MSDITKQKVYEAAKRWVADAEQPLDELIAAIKEHRTAERDEAGPTSSNAAESTPSEQDETPSPGSDSSGNGEPAVDPPDAA